MPPRSLLLLTALLGTVLLTLPGCQRADEDSPVRVDVIGKPRELAEPLDNGMRPTGQALLGATARGLVTYDANGEIVGALAASWIVEDDGRSYIFRLKPLSWHDGKPVTAEEAARMLRRRMAAYPLLLAGLKPRVRAMTDSVLEVDLDAPIPSFLQLLAQPAMAIADTRRGIGPYRASTAGHALLLRAARQSGPDADDQTGEAATRPSILYLRAVRGALAFARFKEGQSDLVLGARYQHAPYVGVAGLGRAAVRVDPVHGLFGLLMTGNSPLLADPDVRAALNDVVDRDRIAARLAAPGWTPAPTLLPAPLDMGRPPTAFGWTDRPYAERQASARDAIAAWRQRNGPPPPLVIALPQGPGSRLLFEVLAQDFTAIGLDVRVVGWTARSADLRLIDEVAPFDSALWYLARIGCTTTPFCDPSAERALDQARRAPSDVQYAGALAEAERLTLARNSFIALGQPVRFALVDARLTGFQASPRARHPLNMLYAQPR